MIRWRGRNLGGLGGDDRYIVNVGGVIDGGTFKIRLADISVATGAANAKADRAVIRGATGADGAGNAVDAHGGS